MAHDPAEIIRDMLSLLKHVGLTGNGVYERALDYVGNVSKDRECPLSPLPSGKHQVDTSMESGPNNCFFCEKPMPRYAGIPLAHLASGSYHPGDDA